MKTIASGRIALLAIAIPLTLALSARAAPSGGNGVTVYHFAGDRPSWVYGLKINGVEVPVTALPNIDAAACERIVAGYDKLPAQCRVPLKFVGLHYAHVAAAGELRVELTASEPIRNFSIHPKRRGIEATADGRVMRFTIDRREPRYFIVEVNDLPPCCLIVDPPEEGAPSPTAENVVNAARFLTDATGKVEQTDGFARAIAAVNGTGKTLYVPPGIYLTDTIKIHKASNLGIYLAPGCLIRIKTSPRGENRHAPGISIDQSKRITISGRGCLDHQAYENFALQGNRYNHLVEGDYRVPVLSQAPVLILRSQDIALRDLTVRNGRNWNVNVVGCDRVTLLRCRILTPPACVPEFADGIDVVSTDGLTIDGCFISLQRRLPGLGQHVVFRFSDAGVGPIAGAEPLRGPRPGRMEPAGQRHSLRRVGRQQHGGHSRHPFRELRFLRHGGVGTVHRRPGAGPKVAATAPLRNAPAGRLRIRLRPRQALRVSDEEGADRAA